MIRKGLVFITLLALLVQALLERAGRQGGLPFTAQRLFQGFRSLQAVDLTWADGSVQRRVTELTPFQAQVLKTFAPRRPEYFVSAAINR